MKTRAETVANLMKDLKELHPSNKVEIKVGNGLTDSIITVSRKENIFQSRKGLVFLIGTALSTLLIALKLIDGNQWMTLFIFLAGIYTGGNVAEKLANSRKP